MEINAHTLPDTYVLTLSSYYETLPRIYCLFHVSLASFNFCDILVGYWNYMRMQVCSRLNRAFHPVISFNVNLLPRLIIGYRRNLYANAFCIYNNNGIGAYSYFFYPFGSHLCFKVQHLQIIDINRTLVSFFYRTAISNDRNHTMSHSLTCSCLPLSRCAFGSQLYHCSPCATLQIELVKFFHPLRSLARCLKMLRCPLVLN